MALLLLPVSSLAAGSEWSLQLRSATLGEVRVEQLRAQVSLGDDGSVKLRQGRSRTWIGDQQLPAQSWQLSLSEQSAQRIAGDLSVRLAGGPRLRGGWSRDHSGRLDISLSPGALKVQIDSAQRWSVSAASMALADWRELLGELAGWTPSALSGSVSMDLKQSPNQALSARGEVSDLAFDSSDGLYAAAGLAASFNATDDPLPKIDLRVSQGELLLSPAYVAIAEAGLELELNRQPAAWQLRASQPGAFSTTVSWPDLATENWQLSATVDDLGEFFQRYALSAWEAQAWPELSAEGQLQLSASGERGKLSELDYQLSADKLGLASLQAEALSSSGRWKRGADGAVELSWRAVGNGDFSLGPAALSAVANGEVWTATNAVQARLLEGDLRIADLRLDQRSEPWQAQAALRLRDIDLAALCRSFGWVEMPGVLTATFPAVSFSADHLSLSGGAQIQAFQGQIDLGAVEVERPLGVAPAVSASATFSSLDLGEVTSVFDFGEITGRMSGHINDLRVVNGKPVAFDALLRTDEGYRGKRQISQRAVNNLSSVGGAGGGALSRSVLRVFDRFRYDAIGLGCRLNNGVCAMTGLEDAEDSGYVIVRGSGLPRITVKGHAQRVDWDTLLARLIAATAGAMPTVE